MDFAVYVIETGNLYGPFDSVEASEFADEWQEEGKTCRTYRLVEWQ